MPDASVRHYIPGTLNVHGNHEGKMLEQTRIHLEIKIIEDGCNLESQSLGKIYITMNRLDEMC